MRNEQNRNISINTNNRISEERDIRWGEED